MSVYMRAVMSDWHDPPLDELAAYVTEHSDFRVRPVGARGWGEFEVDDVRGRTVLAADLTTGSAVREELDELEEFVGELEGPEGARERVEEHLRDAVAIVGMQILMSAYDESVAAANAIVDYLEQRPGTLSQVDTIGWYDGPDLILSEPG